MNIVFILESSIKALESNGFEVWIQDESNDTPMYGMMLRKTILLNISYSKEIQLQTLLCLVRNYLATQNKENFRMKLTDNPQYPREYRPERLEKDKDYQMFCLLHAG